MRRLARRVFLSACRVGQRRLLRPGDRPRQQPLLLSRRCLRQRCCRLHADGQLKRNVSRPGSVERPLAELVAHANRAFCESTLPTQYATLVCGKATPSGEVEICNAGHPTPLVFTRDGVKSDAALANGSSGFPIGLFSQQPYPTFSLQLAPGEFMLLFSDGISEASDSDDQEYGTDRLIEVMRNSAGLPADTVRACIEDVTAFRGDARLADDQTLMVVQRVESTPSFSTAIRDHK